MSNNETEFNFDTIDWNIIKKTTQITPDIHFNNNTNIIIHENNNYDNTTNETYRVRRMFKIDPLSDQEVPENLAFRYNNMWDPYTGTIKSTDPVGPLYFNAITLYDFFFANRYKGLWNPPQDQFQGHYGDLIGTGKKIKIISRGSHPERYLFRLPIIDCYIPPNHSNSYVTMGPELTPDEIAQIDQIVLKHHPAKTKSNFVSLTTLKQYYDNALEPSPNPDCAEMIELVKKYPSYTKKEINEKYNMGWVDKLVKIKY